MRQLRRWMRSLALSSALVLLGTAGPSHASGFFVPEMDAEAMAQGSAFTARARGASAIFFNPAGLTQLEGFSVAAGTTLVDLESTFIGPLPLTFETTTVAPLAPPSHAYVATKLGEKVALGIGLHTSFGLIVEWPQRWPNETNLGSFVLEKVDLKTFIINPTIAYAVSEELSFGVGFQWVRAHAELETQGDLTPLARQLGLPGLPPVQSLLEADNGSGDFGFNVGILYKTEKFGFGVHYKSPVTMKFEGDVDFTPPVLNIPPLDAALAGLFPDQGGDTELPLPDLLLAGVAFRPSEKLELEADVNWANWKDFDEFTITFETPTPAVAAERTSHQDWKNGFTLRVGGDYKVSEDFSLRLGGIYDPTVIPDENLRPLLPESDRFGISGGVGFELGKVDIDLAYLFIKVPERTTTVNEEGFNGTYEGRAHLFGVTLSFGS